MADREWLVDNTQVYESGEEEYFVNGVQINEDQAAAPAAGIAVLRRRMEAA
ncbi:hypothetical protein LCGC14_1042920 [marine sediment metagenome]|uniref:Uncharacterized protein n=1 Tax=marine sediment metagenome TaxID=412755 RepID=A0A0F9MVP4_9ZZZZ